MQEWDYRRLPVQEQEHGVGEPVRLSFHLVHKTKELPVTSPGPPTAKLDGGWGVRKWQRVCVGGNVGYSGGVTTKM